MLLQVPPRHFSRQSTCQGEFPVPRSAASISAVPRPMIPGSPVVHLLGDLFLSIMKPERTVHESEKVLRGRQASRLGRPTAVAAPRKATGPPLPHPCLTVSWFCRSVADQRDVKPETRARVCAKQQARFEVGEGNKVRRSRPAGCQGFPSSFPFERLHPVPWVAPITVPDCLPCFVFSQPQPSSPPPLFSLSDTLRPPPLPV